MNNVGDTNIIFQPGARSRSYIVRPTFLSVPGVEVLIAPLLSLPVPNGCDNITRFQRSFITMDQVDNINLIGHMVAMVPTSFRLAA